MLRYLDTICYDITDPQHLSMLLIYRGALNPKRKWEDPPPAPAEPEHICKAINHGDFKKKIITSQSNHNFKKLTLIHLLVFGSLIAHDLMWNDRAFFFSNAVERQSPESPERKSPEWKKKSPEWALTYRQRHRQKSPAHRQRIARANRQNHRQRAEKSPAPGLFAPLFRAHSISQCYTKREI